MSGKTLYDVLGVNRTATAAEIRAAYLLRSKVLHPDRFDPVQQATEWKLANEMLKELNHAYGVLRNSLDRADYDRTLTPPSSKQPTQTQQSAPRSQPSSPPRQPSVKLGKLESGRAQLNSLPRSVQERLRKRVAGEIGQQLSVKISGVGGNYFIGALCLCWYWFLVSAGDGPRWTTEGWPFLIISCVVAVVQGFNADWILNWHLSPLRQRLLITPLYVIKTRWDEVWYWPLWDVTGMNATHRYTNGNYQGTDLCLSFKSHTENLKISPEEAYESIRQAMLAFTKKIQSARDQNDWQFFLDEDDFRDFDLDKVSATRTRHLSKRKVAIFASSFLLSAIVFGIAWSINENWRMPSSPTYAASAPATTPSSSYPNTPSVQYQLPDWRNPPPAKFTQPELELPANGTVVNYSEAEAVAPFEIKSSFGDHYLVKLADAQTGETVMKIFVRGGSPVSVDVPVGTYVVKYASGSKWYGYKYLFGPDTSYSKASENFYFRYNGNHVEGYTITLYKVPNGNLHTQKIAPSEF